MARARRICFPGAIFHITIKGNNGEDIFAKDSDKQEFLQILWKYKKQFGFSLFSFVLMINHGHLTIQVTVNGSVSDIMHCIKSNYSRRFNWSHGRRGHVFQDRFHAKLIQDDSYLLKATQYDHLNPLKAKIVKKPEDYTWSSYRVYLNMMPCTIFDVDTEKVLDIMSPDKDKQVALYKDFVESATLEEQERFEKYLLY